MARLISIWLSLLIAVLPVGQSLASCCPVDVPQAASLESQAQAPCHQQMNEMAAAQPQQDKTPSHDCHHGGHCCSAMAVALPAFGSLLEAATAQAPANVDMAQAPSPNLPGLKRPPRTC